MLQSYQDGIVAGLVKRGYVVALASGEKSSTNREDQVSALIVLTVYKLDDKMSTSKLYEDLAFILTDIKAYFYSVVIADSTTSTWVGSNILLQPEKEIPQLTPAPDTKKSKLN